MIRQRKKMAMKKKGGKIAMKNGGRIAMKSKGGRIAMKKKGGTVYKKKGGRIAMKNGGVAMTVAAAKKLLKEKGFTVTKTKKKK